ncbi:MAG: nitroreductase family protein [Kiritimatiellae bacterium]|nr:nitroreductase family protein [Kiritimatiellia bacterium]
MLEFHVDESLCTHCKECARDCPSRVIALSDDGIPSLTPEAEQNCIRCQHCLAICPTGAISILGKQPGDSLVLDPSALPTLDAMEQLVCGRRTTRRYKPENVSPETIQRLLDATAHAPTGANRRALTFAVIDDRDEMKSIRQRVMEALQSAIEAGSVPEELAYLHAAVPAFFKYRADLVFRGAPHLLLVSAGPDALCPNEDVVIALSTFEMLATAAGLGTTWCGMLQMVLESVPELKSLFDLPDDHTYYAMLFGIPKVKYARATQRKGSATIQRLTAGDKKP